MLWEAGERLDGQLPLAARVTGGRDLAGIVDWRARELARLGVDVRLGTYAAAEDVLAEKPDAVIVATGGVPDFSEIEGSIDCTSVWDILGGGRVIAADVLVHDVVGHYQALSCALHLAGQGTRVAFVTPEGGIEMSYSDRAMFRKRFAQTGIQLDTDQEMLGIERRGNRLVARFRNALTGTASEREAAQIVTENGTSPYQRPF